jgi:REP element-mobilizing transposase RayT
MSNTYHQIYIHGVFAVKNRNAMIGMSWKPTMMAVIGNLINETGSTNILVNGVNDHTHCLFELKPSVSISNVMKIAKSKSSKWLNENNLLRYHFEWQSGFGAFSYSHSQIDLLYKYILNQERHHQHQSFRDEYIELLTKFNVNFDENYIFHDLI